MASTVKARTQLDRHPDTMAIVGGLAAIKVLLHLATASRYGIFRDELYLHRVRAAPCIRIRRSPAVDRAHYLVRSAHDGLLPALAGGGLFYLTAQLSRQLGGGRFAQVMAALSILSVPIYLLLQHWLTMNAFEPLLWTAVLWAVLRIVPLPVGQRCSSSRAS